MPRLARWLPHLSLLSLVTLAFTLMPVSPALAARTEDRTVTNLITDFGKGKLQRTSVAADTTTGVTNDGSVALSPVGYIRNWQESSFPLPERVSDHGAVTINGRIYILGGTVYNTVNQTKLATAHVWAGTPGADGNLSDPPGGTPAWQALADLPAVPASDPPGAISPCAQTLSPTPARSSVAAAGLSVGTGGFIYAIGGSLAPTTGDPYSTSAVAIGKVEANGTISSWRSPATMCLPKAVQAASATVITVGSDSYLYVVGGLFRQAPTGPIPFTQEGSRAVYFARINPQTGDLTKPSDGSQGWDTGFDIPVPDNDPTREEGIWNATVIPVSGDFSGRTYYALYLMGGETLPGANVPSDSALVFRGLIDPTTKQVSWNIPIDGGGTFSAALNSARRGLRAVVYDGANIIVTGGKQGNATNAGAISSALSNQVDDKLELPVYGDQSVNFFNNPDTLPQGRGRYNHGAVVVQVGADRYVYMLGGIGNGPTEGDQTDTVFYGKIETAASPDAGYALNGRYNSATYPIDISKARLLAVRWNADIDRSAGNMDIEIEYRVNNDANKLEQNWSQWFKATDPGAGGTFQTKNGQNASQLPESLEFIFFEYRATLRTYNPSGGAWKTPTLRSLGIQVEVPGYPNLQIPTAQQITVDNLVRGIQVTIANKNPLPAGNPLQSADEGSNGQFFVDVYITPPGQPAQPPTLGQTGQAYAKLNKRDFPPEANRVVRNWLDGSPGASNAEFDITSLFTQSGNYTIYVMVDSVDSAAVGTNPFGLVQEADVAGQQGEADNVFGPLTVTVTTPCPAQGCGLPPVTSQPTILMPLVFKS